MAGNIPPLVSSTPPPLCAFDDDEEEEDDEFGIYNTAEEIDYSGCISYREKSSEKQNAGKSRREQDSTSQDSATDSGLCPDSEGMSPIPHSDDERAVKQNSFEKFCQKSVEQSPYCRKNPGESLETSPVNIKKTQCLNLPNGHVESDHCTPTEFDDDFGTFEFASSHDVELHEGGKCSGEEVSNTDSTSNHPVTLENNSSIPLSEKLSEQEQSSDEFENSVDKKLETSSSDNSFDSSLENKNILSSGFLNIERSSLNKSEESENIDPECSVQTAVENVDNVEKLDNCEVHDEDEFDEFTDFQSEFSNGCDPSKCEHSDELNEHAITFLEQKDAQEGTSLLHSHQDESDDEFSNFADFSSSDCAFISAQSSNSLENVSHIPFKVDDNDLRTESEFQDWVSVFPCDTGDSSIVCGPTLLREDDNVWSRLFPLESSPALSYQWNDSLANRRLLSALNIDSRNILFMPWSNSTVPRFAANLSCGPLEPTKATEPIQPTPPPLPAPTISSTQESVPDAHFDWVSSGLTNPLDCPKTVLNLPKTLSAEAEAILRMVPDISFMRKTYIDFPINEA